MIKPALFNGANSSAPAEIVWFVIAMDEKAYLRGSDGNPNLKHRGAPVLSMGRHCPSGVVWIAVMATGLFAVLNAAASGPVSATVYVDRHFEVRDHDQPVKYVFNGDTRVARITGVLSPVTRVQRVRLFPAWNLVSLAVTATNLAGQLDQVMVGPSPVITALYRWEPATAQYATVTGGQAVASGSVLWVRAVTNLVVGIHGDYVDPATPRVPAGGGYVPGPGLEQWPLQLPPRVSVWKFDAAASHWLGGLTDDLASVSDLPPTLAAGDAIYVHTAEQVELSIPDPVLRIAYYHQDHLGSSSVITDANGALIEETAFYPFGTPRNEFQPRQVHEPYQFTQKERDSETALHYFEARYLAGSLSRFVAPDRKYAEPDFLSQQDRSAFLSQPQQINLYAYVRNNPARYVDPTGHETRRPRRETPSPAPSARAPERSSLALSGIDREIEIRSFAFKPEGASASSHAESSEAQQRKTSSVVISTPVDESTAQLFKAAAGGKTFEEAVITLRRPGGEAYGKIKLTGAVVSGSSLGSSGSESAPTQNVTITARTVEIEIIKTPEPPGPLPVPYPNTSSAKPFIIEWFDSVFISN